MRKPAVDVRRLADFLAERLRVVALELSPLDVKCAWPVFRGTAVGRPPVFVKVTDRAAAERTLAFLRTAARPNRGFRRPDRSRPASGMTWPPVGTDATSG